MRAKTLVALFGALLLALVTTAGTASAQTTYPTPPASSEEGFLSDSSIAQGEAVVFGGDGFEPGTDVDVAVDGEVLGSVEADENGEFAVELEFEDCGEFTLTGSGTGSEGEARTVTASVEVVCAEDEDEDDNGGDGGNTGNTGGTTGGTGSGGGATMGNGSTGNGSTGTVSTGSQLPRTGSDVTTTALVSGLVLITVGALFVFGARTRARRIV